MDKSKIDTASVEAMIYLPVHSTAAPWHKEAVRRYEGIHLLIMGLSSSGNFGTDEVADRVGRRGN